MDKNTKKKTLSIASDLIYSIAGLMLMNGMLQLLINPTLNNWMGEDAFGNYQSVLAVVSIMGTTFGVAANYSRMVKHREHKDCNTDYSIFLIIISALCIPVSAAALIMYKSFTVGAFLLLVPLSIFTVLRYYGDVNYRMNLNYKGFFIYYAVITLGYCVGLLFYKLTGKWELTILSGELLAFIFVFSSGKIFRGEPFKKSPYFKENIKSMTVLSSTNIISAVAQNSDRIILRFATGGGDAVTTFYVSTLLGKVVSLLTTPLNGVLIGYLTKYEGKITKKMYLIFSGALLGVGVIAMAGCYVGSMIFVKLFYPNVYDAAKSYFFLANAGQIFYFISNCLMTVMLRIANEKYQMYLNIVYAVIFAATVLPMTLAMELTGLTYSLLIANAAKFILIVAVGLVKIQKDSRKEISE